MPTPYALLMMAVPDDHNHEAVVDLGRNTLTWSGMLEKVLDVERHISWKEELGRRRWNQLLTGHRFFLVHSETDRDHAIWRALLGWHAIHLAGLLTPYSGEGYLFSGEADAVSSEKLRLTTLETFQPTYATKMPLYFALPEYEAAHPATVMDPWFDRWRSWIEILDNYGPKGLPQILNVAIRAFERGLQRSHFDDKLPELVRAAESILAVPRGRTATEFTQRSLKLVPTLGSLPYLQSASAPMLPQSHVSADSKGAGYQRWFNASGTTDIERWLAVLYGHRSDCVHGKIPFEELRQQIGGESEAARFDYLAETLAREAICYALRNPARFVEFKDRATLETAWHPSGWDPQDPNSPQPRMP